MRLSVASSALAAAFVLAPVAAGYAPALGQDFSITNEMAPPIPGHPNLMPQLQAWWNLHAYYPRHASDNNEGGTVKVHLTILPDGRIWKIDVVGSSGSRSLDTVGGAVFVGGAVRPFPAGETPADVDLSLHYVLAYPHGQTVAAGSAPPAAAKGPFTITNQPVKSPVLTTMLQRDCSGTITLGGVANEPIYGMHVQAEAIFFHKPDGTPWVKFSEKGVTGISPVTQIGNMVTWTGPAQMQLGVTIWFQYTGWADGDNHLHGAVGSRIYNYLGVPVNSNVSGTSLDLTCATQVLPSVSWSNALGTPLMTSPVDLSSSDPP